MPITITVGADGPYIISGDDAARVTVVGHPTDGGAIALCRCGASNAKPFCDGSHARVGFRGGEGAPAPAAQVAPTTPNEAAAVPAPAAADAHASRD